MSDRPLRAFQKRVFLVAVVLHAIAAWFSSGYYADDEHYQVIAFAQQRLGELPGYEMPWEYEAHIRSALLPSVAYMAIRACRAWLSSDPFIIAFLLRAITAVCALFVVRRFIDAALPMVKLEHQRLFIALSWCLWFLPYQHVRFASETWSGLLFVLGLSTVLSRSSSARSMVTVGLCFGLSTLVKPAMGIACMSVCLWWVLGSVDRRRLSVLLIAGLLLALIAGSVVDAWFYKGFYPALVNYARMAISGDAPRSFEVHPWYSYLPWTIKYAVWPIGALLVAALLWSTYRAPRSLLVWCIWPYLIALSIVPHKELRFLFPLADLSPLLLVLALQALGESALARMMTRPGVLVPLIAINACGLFVSATTAAGSGRTRLAETLWRNVTGRSTSIGYDFEDDLIWKARIPSFYLPTGVGDVGICDPCSPANALAGTPTAELLVVQESYDSSCTPEALGYRPLIRSESELATQFLDLYNSERPRPYVLHAHEARTSRPSEP